MSKTKDILKKYMPLLLSGLKFSVSEGISYNVGNVFRQRLSQLSLEEQKEFHEALVETLRGGIEAFREELQDISSKDQVEKIAELLEENIQRQKDEILKSCFIPVEDRFEYEISKNFLHELFDHDIDYLQLLSNDLRQLFFKRFNECNRTNEYNRICIVGKEGVGKTFNSFLIGKKLEEEGYNVYYCEDITDANVSGTVFSEIMDSFDQRFVFIIDKCEADESKTEEIIKRITKAKSYATKPRFVFLTRPREREDMENMFGEDKILEFKDTYINFEYLVALFFESINLGEKLNDFLTSLKQYDLSKVLFKYRNMAFWDFFFNSTREHMKLAREVKIKERKFYEVAYRFLEKNERDLIQNKDVLAKLLPIFMNEIPIRTIYVRENLQIDDAKIEELKEKGVVSIKDQNWDNKNWENAFAEFVVSKIHPTKARILLTILEKHEDVQVDAVSMITDYANAYYENMYRIITPFYESEELEKLCRSERFISILKKYFRERHLGKELDRTIRTFAKLEPQLKDKVIDDETISSLAEKINAKGPYLVSKLYLFRAMYKFSLLKTYELYKNFDSKVFIDDFNGAPNGISSFSKFMEIFKNIYKYSDQDGKAQLRDTLKEILDACSVQYIKKFDEYDSLGEFNWTLHRLDGIKVKPYSKVSLANYFYSKIPPLKILEWIRHKDTDVGQLRFVFKIARFAFAQINGIERNLYHDYFKNSFNYEDAERIFSHERSGLYDIAITSKFAHETLANYLYQYSFTVSFKEKVSKENDLYRINESISLVESNPGLLEESKESIIREIVEATKFGERMFRDTIRIAKKLGKGIDIDREKERFLSYKRKYGRNFA